MRESRLYHSAVRRIAELESSLAQAREEIEKLKNHEHNSLCEGCVKFCSGLYIERDRYRQALEKISNDKRYPPVMDQGAVNSYFEVIKLTAKKVLSEGGKQ